MDRTSFSKPFDATVPGRESELIEEVISRIVARTVAPLLARIEQLELERQASSSGERPSAGRRSGESQADAASLEWDQAFATSPPRGLNPYQVTAGPELDALIHRTVMRQNGNSTQSPAYSTDMGEAKKVIAQLKILYRVPVVSGRTSIEGQPWFARITLAGEHGTEALAQSLPLAICRLALIQGTRSSPAKSTPEAPVRAELAS